MGLTSKLLFPGCVLIALALLIGAYALAGLWPVGLAISLAILAGWLALRSQRGWLAPACLVLYVGVAAGGLLLGGQPALLIAGSAFALAGWELATRPAGSLDERAHLVPLFLSVGLGFLLAEAGLFIHVALPFGVIFFAVLLAFLGVYGIFRLFKVQG